MAARRLLEVLRAEPRALHDAFPYKLVPDQGTGTRTTQVPPVGF